MSLRSERTSPSSRTSSWALSSKYFWLSSYFLSKSSNSWSLLLAWARSVFASFCSSSAFLLASADSSVFWAIKLSTFLYFSSSSPSRVYGSNLRQKGETVMSVITFKSLRWKTFFFPGEAKHLRLRNSFILNCNFNNNARKIKNYKPATVAHRWVASCGACTHFNPGTLEGGGGSALEASPVNTAPSPPNREHRVWNNRYKLIMKNHF